MFRKQNAAKQSGDASIHFPLFDLIKGFSQSCQYHHALDCRSTFLHFREQTVIDSEIKPDKQQQRH